MSTDVDRSLLQRAMVAAHTAACDEAAPEQAWVSFPVPAPGGLAFLVAGSYLDPAAETMSAHPPSVAVYVEVPSLHCRLVEWPPEEQGPRRLVWTTAASELSAGGREALLQEAADLAAEVATNIGGESDALERYDLLYRFFVSPETRALYERLSPEYFSWRNGKLQSDARSQPSAAPEPSYPVEASAIPDPLAAELLRQAEGFPRHYEVGTPALFGAIRELGLEPSGLSPLAALSDEGDPGGYRLQDIVPGWPSAEIKAALAALCDPELRIEVLCGTHDVVIPVTACAGTYDGEPAWVRFEEVDGTASIYAPDMAQWTYELVQETLASPAVRRADPTVHQLSGAEFAALVAMADHVLATGDYESPIELAGLSLDREQLSWSSVEALTRPEDAPSPVIEGVGQLRQRGLVDGPPEAVTMASSLRAFIQVLDKPQAFAVIQTVERVDGKPVSSVVSFLRTSEELWAWEADEGDAVNLWQVTGTQVTAILDELLGLREDA